MELDPSRTYTMNASFGRGGALVLDPVDDIDSAGLACGEVAPAVPVRLRTQSRRRVGDLVSGPLPLTVVSARFVGVLRDGGFSGWTTIPVEVIGPLSEELSDHRGLVITGRNGSVDRSRSERVVLPPPVPQGEATPHLRGLYPQNWDGSDLFLPEKTWHVCVAEAVRDAVNAAGLVGVEFTRLTEYTVIHIDDV